LLDKHFASNGFAHSARAERDDDANMNQMRGNKKAPAKADACS